MVPSDLRDFHLIPDYNSIAFDNLRQGIKLHKETFLQSDKEIKGVDHDPL